MSEYSRKFPSAAVHMELAYTTRALGLHLEVSHAKREHNVWADELTNKDFGAWDAKRRWDPPLPPDFFYVLDRLVNLTAAPQRT